MIGSLYGEAGNKRLTARQAAVSAETLWHRYSCDQLFVLRSVKRTEINLAHWRPAYRNVCKGLPVSHKISTVNNGRLWRNDAKIVSIAKALRTSSKSQETDKNLANGRKTRWENMKSLFFLLYRKNVLITNEDRAWDLLSRQANAKSE